MVRALIESVFLFIKLIHFLYYNNQYIDNAVQAFQIYNLKYHKKLSFIYKLSIKTKLIVTSQIYFLLTKIVLVKKFLRNTTVMFLVKTVMSMKETRFFIVNICVQ